VSNEIVDLALITEYASSEHEIAIAMYWKYKALAFLKQLGYKQHLNHIKQENF
jgi:hypothetical protein